MLRKLARRLKRSHVGPVALALAAGWLAAGCGDDGDEDKARAPAGAGAGPGVRVAKASATADAAAKAYTPTGRLIADSGFRPEKDGFSFENYAGGFQDLTPQELQDLFGPGVCASGSGAGCVLTPPAQAWMNTMNQSMQGGHCYGFSVLANAMFDRLANPLDYGGQTPPTLALAGNTALQRQLAESFTHQLLESVLAGTVVGTPNEVLDVLINALNTHPDTYTVGVIARDFSVGHAITPYAVEDKGNGQFAILVYDNNFPGITRAVELDRNKNTWSYEAAANPAEESFLLEGDAATQTLVMKPTTPGLGAQPCPFCTSVGSARAPAASLRGGRVRPRRRTLDTGGYDQISLQGDTINHSHIVITDRRGRRTGFVDGRLRREIPGVQVVQLVRNQNWKERPEPTYLVPRRLEVTISIDGSRLRSAATESLSVIGPGYSTVLGDVTVRPDERHRVQVRGNGKRLVYRAAPGRTQSPDIEIGLERSGADVTFAVAAHEMKAGSALTASVAPSGKALKLDGSGARNARANAVVGFIELRPSGARVARHRTTPLGPKTSCRFRGGRGTACRRTGR